MILIESDYGFDTGILRKRAVPVGWHFEKARATDGAEGWHQSVVPRACIEMIAVYAVSGLVQ